MREPEGFFGRRGSVHPNHVLGAVAVTIAARQFMKPQEREHARGRTRRPRVVVRRAWPVHEPLAVPGCEVEPVLPELLEDELDELRGSIEIPLFEPGLIEDAERVVPESGLMHEA